MREKIKNIVTLCALGLVIGILFVLLLTKAPTEYSDSERRALAQFLPPTAENILSGEFMENFESYAQDQFPFRDGFRTVKSVAVYDVFRQKDNHDIYLVNGYAAKQEYPLKEEMLLHATERFSYIYDTYLKGTNTQNYLSIIPDKNYFLAGEGGYLSMDYESLVNTVRENTDFLTYIDIMDTLSLSDYYRTDTHWKQENIGGVAEILAEGMGADLGNPVYIEQVLDQPFFGVYRGQAAIPMEADTITYLTSEELSACTVTLYDSGMPETIPMYDMEKATGKDPYEMFLSGAVALLSIENPVAANGKELILFRDSFGSSIAPLLVSGYEKITLVDIRYIQPDFLGAFIEFTDQDVLFLYSTSILNQSLSLK